MDDDYLKSGYYVRYLPPNTRDHEFYLLGEEEVQPSYIFHGFGSVTAAGNSGYKEVKDLKPAKNHLFQLRMGIQTACLIYVQLPVGTTLGGTDEKRTETSTWHAIGFFNHRQSPFWGPTAITNMYLSYWAGTRTHPALKAYNPTDKTLVPRVRFVGKMFETELISDPDLLMRLKKRIVPWTPVSIGILPGKGRSA